MPRFTVNPQPFQPTASVSVDRLQSPLALLMSRYVKNPSRSAAAAVIEAIDRRRQEPHPAWTADERCACLRLRAHWQMLTFTSPKG